MDSHSHAVIHGIPILSREARLELAKAMTAGNGNPVILSENSASGSLLSIQNDEEPVYSA
jgi:hypothetical protein